MNKHALMLTAATVALMAGPAFAVGPTSITSKKETTAQKTSTTGDLTIGAGGSVEVKLGSAAVTIDSDNFVKLSTSDAKITNLDTSGAIGVQLNATTGAGTTGSLNSLGAIDLTGTGTGKTGILVALATPSLTAGTFNGDITLGAGSTTKVTGNNSIGINVASGTTLVGNVTILGGLVVNPTSLTATTASGIYAMTVYGDITGNIDIGSGGGMQAVGAGANGLAISGDVTGSLTNAGTLSVVGTGTPKTGGGNPEAGSALIIAGNILGGIENGGPSPSSSGATAATLGGQGIGPAINISPTVLGSTTSTGLEIGVYKNDPDGQNFSFLNRGTISQQSQDPNNSETAISMSGSNGAHVTLDGGILNSGVISATAASDGKIVSTYNATALFIGSYVDVMSPGIAYNLSTAALVNTDEAGATGGQITASVSGSTGGVATAVFIGANSTLGSLYNSGTIRATASTTDTTISSSLMAYAIDDLSGSLSTITNSGTISATATTLDSGAQKAVAAYLAANPGNIQFTNSGAVVGDIEFGVGNDTLDVTGTLGGATASVVGDIAFGGTNGGYDTLTIGTSGNGSVTGAVREVGGGRVNVTIGGALGGVGVLTLKNTDTSLTANDLTVNDGGTLDISLSNGFNQTTDPANPAFIIAHDVNFSSLAKLNLAFGSFVATPNGSAQFTLIDADKSASFLDAAAIESNIKFPYLFNGTLCANNISSFTTDCGGTTTHNQLILSLTPKTVGLDPLTQIPLTGNAARIFDYANAALATDDTLGGNIVTYVTGPDSAQAAYSSFVPDLSGSTRAVAVSLTDQATGPVGARQRALRMYASQPGGATLWGQEFVQRLNSGGNADAYRASGFGFVLGADGGDPRSGRYGGAFTFFSGDQTNKGPNFTKTTNEWYMLSGYTDWRGKGLFVDSQLTAGYGSLNGTRMLQLEDGSGNVVLTRKAKGKRAGLLVAGGISTGVVLAYGGTVITPQFSIDGLTMREEGYTETGGGAGTAGADGFDLRVQPYYANSVRGYFGTTFRQDIDFGDFFIQPEARIGYRYDFLSDAVKLKAAFASMAATPGNEFTLTGPDPERGNVVAGGSLAVTTGAWSLGLNYDYLRGNSGAVSQTGTVTLIGRI